LLASSPHYPRFSETASIRWPILRSLVTPTLVEISANPSSQQYHLLQGGPDENQKGEYVRMNPHFNQPYLFL
jgi:hypothetical protein